MTSGTRADAQINVRRMSLRAYDTAVNSARTDPAAAASASTGPSDTGAWAELEESGLARSGQLVQEWAQALTAAPSAPVQVRVVARSGRVVFDTDVVLLPGLGLATTQRSIVEGGTSDATHEPAVELVAFPPEQLWPVVRRVLPPDDALRADARPTPPSQRRPLPVPDGVRDRLTLLPKELPDSTRDQQLNDLPDSEQPWAAILAGHDAQVVLLVAAQTPEQGSVPLGRHRWVMADEQLYEVRGSVRNMVAVQPGAIAHELIYLVTGAYASAVARLENEARR